jgi:tetratricopeptide (TPR) repeat protein
MLVAETIVLTNGEFWGDALRVLERAQSVALTVDSPRLEGIMLWYLGSVYEAGEELPAALNAYEEADDMLRTAKFESRDSIRAGVLVSIGEVHRMLGDYRSSREAFEAALSLHTALENELAMAYDHLGLGQAYVDTDQQKAVLHLNQAIEISGDKDRRLKGLAHFNLGIAFIMRSREFELALEHFAVARIELEKTDDKFVQLHAIILMADARRLMDEYEPAGALLDEANARMELWTSSGETPDPSAKGLLHFARGLLAKDQRDYERARAELQKACEVYGRIDQEWARETLRRARRSLRVVEGRLD